MHVCAPDTVPARRLVREALVARLAVRVRRAAGPGRALLVVRVYGAVGMCEDDFLYVDLCCGALADAVAWADLGGETVAVDRGRERCCDAVHWEGVDGDRPVCDAPHEDAVVEAGHE